jgi:hypothetical protein
MIDRKQVPSMVASQSREEKHDAFVWVSTLESVKADTFSVLAALEIIIAILLYWSAAIFFQTQAHLWVSIVVAPLLLLRSKASVALGIQWFEKFVDYGFSQSPKDALSSARLWISAAASVIVIIGLSDFLASVFLVGRSPQMAAVYGIAVGYVSAQTGVAVALAIAANEIATIIIHWRIAAFVIAFSSAAAFATGVFLSKADDISGVTAIASVTFLAVLGMKTVSSMRVAISHALVSSQDEARGVVAARGFLSNAPGSFAAFAPGMFIGGWVRSVSIRFRATLCCLWSGFLALPENWWRTLFVIDFRHPPEIVPGYEKPDLLQTSQWLTEIKQARTFLEMLVYLTGFAVLFLPAYVYRITIKSTCWFYLPIIYIVRARRFKDTPEFFADLLWNSPFEWCRRLAATTVLAVLFVNQAMSAHTNVLLPTEVVSPIEYVFVIDLHAIRPWQWFSLTSALLTIFILFFAGTFRIFVRHADGGRLIDNAIVRRALILEYAMRVRNLSTFLFLFIAFCHILVWQVPGYLPTYIFDLLQALFRK